MKLTPSEKIARNFLLAKGYTTKEIYHNSRESPDFRCADGKCWEVKQVQNNGIFFTRSQLTSCKNSKIILVDAKTKQILKVSSFNNVIKNDRYKIRIIEQPKGIIGYPLKSNNEDWKAFKNVTPSSVSVNEALNQALKEYIARRQPIGQPVEA